MRSPVTNADRIRAMSDEELAKWLETWGMYPFDADGTSWTDWLKYEVGNESSTSKKMDK